MRRLRVLVHAMDRTGPPMLALALLGWVRAHHPDVALDVVGFRGGALEARFAAFGEVVVLLGPGEPWDHASPVPARAAAATAALADLPTADVTLLVSVAAGQSLAHLPDDGPIATWVVEQGEDLHWLDDEIGLRERTDLWLAGSAGSRRELVERQIDGARVDAAPEFVAAPSPPDPEVVAEIRAASGVGDGGLLVVGAGIATHRKAPDLFLEVALASLRSTPRAPDRWTWIGGEDDELHELVVEEAARLGVHDRIAFEPSTDDLLAWLAAADVVVHPARLDAFPLVCLHAASVATPVVGFAQVAGLEEMFGDAHVGAPFPDVQGLARRVAELRSADARRALGARQHARFEDRWSAESAAPVLWGHLLRLVEEAA